MSFEECDQFEQGTRKWLICRGEVELPSKKINSYRRMWGLPPLFEESYPTEQFVSTEVPELIFHGTSVGGDDVHKKLYGPGTELLNLYSSYGIPHCSACMDLAQRMNNWGVVECGNRVEEIVADIVPRAKEWIAANHSWIASWVPSSIEDYAIRCKVRSDIAHAIAECERVMSSRIKRKLNPYTGKKNTGCSSCR